MNYPKIKSVFPNNDKTLTVIFDNNVKKKYDCAPLLNNEIFSPLVNDLFFQKVTVDKGGYGVIWNDELDIAESELWINGRTDN